VSSAEVSIRSLYRFAHSIGLIASIDGLSEPRKRPQISLFTMVSSVVLGMCLDPHSSRQLDLLLRFPLFKKLLQEQNQHALDLRSKRQKKKDRAGVVSDSTLWRVFPKMSVEQLRRRLDFFRRHLVRRGLLQAPVGRRSLRIGAIDGTCQGKKLFSFIAQLGDVPVVGWMRPMSKKGKELPTSLSLMEDLPPGTFDLFLADSLYANRGFFEACLQAKMAGVVKTNEDLWVIRDAVSLMKAWPQGGPEVEYIQGTDAERACHYRAWTVADLAWESPYESRKSALRFSVTRVEEYPLKGRNKEPELFYVIGQEASLGAASYRELGHDRWFIENNVHKALNGSTRSKRLWSHDDTAAQIMTILQTMAWMLLEAFQNSLESAKASMRRLWDHGQLSLITLSHLLRTTLGNPTLADSG
jgi:hypothetical protein